MDVLEGERWLEPRHSNRRKKGIFGFSEKEGSANIRREGWGLSTARVTCGGHEHYMGCRADRTVHESME